MLTFSLISLVYTLPAVALIALMRSTLLPDFLKKHRWLAMALESALWVVGVQFIAEGVLLHLAFDLMRPGAIQSDSGSASGLALRCVAAAPVFALPLLMRMGPMMCLVGSLLWAILLGQPMFIESSTGLSIDRPLASINVGLFLLTPITLTYFLVGALWFLSIQRANGLLQVRMPKPRLPGSLARRGLAAQFDGLLRWCEAFGLYVWLAMGLILASAGLMSLQAPRIENYGLVLFYNLASILLAFWMLWSGNERIRSLLAAQETLTKRQISGLENHLFMRQQQICRMLSAAGAGAVFWQARHAHVFNGSQEWRTGLVEYRLNALNLHLPVRTSDNLEIFFRKCFPVAEFHRIEQAMDSIFKGDQTHFAMELEGVQLASDQRSYKLFANALRSHDGLGILFLDMLMIDYSQEKALRHRLADSAEARRDTLLSVGHDLGSPLGLIRIATSILRRHLAHEQAGDNITRRQLNRIESCVKEADAYLKNAIDFAQSDNPDHVYPVGDLQVDSWLRELLDGQRGIYGVDQSLISLAVKDGLILHGIQVQPFQMLLTNLVSNAFKYGASQGGPVHVAVRVDETHALGPSILVDVSDRGHGIPQSVRQSLFQPFRRGENAAEIKGCGLGLAIVRRAALCMKAHIDLLSQTAGAHFRIRIPLNATASDSQQARSLPDGTTHTMQQLTAPPAEIARPVSASLNPQLPAQALPLL